MTDRTPPVKGTRVHCNGCGANVAFNDMVTHDFACDTHSHRGPDGWTPCTHTETRCYRPTEVAA